MTSKIDQAIEDLKIYIRARYPIIYIQSDEKEMDVIKEMVRICTFGTKSINGKSKFQKKLVHWDIVNGLTTPVIGEKGVEWRIEKEDTEDPLTALNYIMQENKDQDQIFVLSEFHHYLDDIQVQRRLRIFSQTVAISQRKIIVLLSPKNDGMSGSGKVVPTELENIVHLFSWPYPDTEHIKKVLTRNFIPNLNEGLAASGYETMKFSEEELREIIDACKGMTVAQIDNATAKSVVTFETLVPSEIAKEKKQIIKKSGLCEYIEPHGSLSDIGGNECLKDWLQRRKSIQTEEAYNYGCDLPRGVLLLGPWGSGKSSAAKAIISEWQIPGIRIDASKIYSMYVGQSICGEESVILWDKSKNVILKKQMNDHDFWKNVEKREIYVQSMDLKNHRSCWKKVKSHIIHNKNNNDLVKIKTFSGKEITVTQDHSLFSYNDIGKITEIEGSKIYPGKQLVRPSQMDNIGIDEYNGINLSKELCLIIGLWLGDGSISRSNNSLRYRIHSSEKEYREIEEIIEKSGHTCSSHKNKDSKSVTIFLDSILSKKLIDLGLEGTSKTKRLPSFIHGLDFHKKALVVRGYFSADGCSLSKQIEVASVNKELLFDFQKITDELGFSFKIRSKKRKTNFKCESEIHRLFISDNHQCRNFNMLIGWLFGKEKEYKVSTIERRSERINSFPAIENIRKEINRKRYSQNKKGLVRTKKYDRHRIGAECIRNGISIQESGCDILYASYEIDTVQKVENVSIESNFVYDLSVEDTENFVTASGFLVHNSEQRINAILELAESVSPCVLWWDEIENLLSGNDGPNDGGASSRVVGIISTWMAEHEGMVFNIFTANDISGRPPKLFRKGRLDEIFVVDLPVMQERVEIIKIHLKKRLDRRGDLDILDGIDYDILAENSSNFSGSELEAAINSAFIDAYVGGAKTICTEDILKSIRETIPMAKTMREDIIKIREWAHGRAVRASSYDPEPIVSGSSISQGSNQRVVFGE